ncbi:RimK family alpha-L-glutamate ligase [Streptomyces olivoreticuli]|uniref:Lysine biosynthesis protein LysX n=2 Tax=Streptomyces blastmyceticus TaxID=68180 RepID=A0ABP3HJ43_9ACTN
MTTSTRPGPFAMLASRMRADEKRLLDAFERRGAHCEYVDSRASWSLLHAQRPPWRIVLNREIGHARALYAARALEAAGATVVNSAAATEVCGDKWQTSVALRRAGLPTPRTALALTPEAALDALEEIGYPAVVKPLVGSWGRLVTLLPDRRTAETVMEYIAALPAPQSHIVYVQELIAKPDRDIRMIVVGGEVLGATYRRGTQWRTNVARGATTEAFTPSPGMAELAVMAAKTVAADIAGVDLIESDDGEVVVLEVNHGVEFSGFQRAMGDRVDVADRIVEHLMTRSESCCE